MTEGSKERRAPSAVGTLESRPLVHLLVYARNRRLSGSLEVHAPDGRHGRIDLWRGRIPSVHTAPPVMYFGALAYELGLIDTATLDTTLLEISKSKRLHGEVLVERGALTVAQRDSVLLEQTCRKVHHLFSLPPESTFAFYDVTPSTEEPAFTLDPIKPAWRGVRESPPAESVFEVLARFASTTLRLSNEGPLAHAGFEPDEASLCEALTWKPMTIAQLRASSSLPGARVELLAYFLIITKCAEPVSTSSANIPAATPATPAAPSAPVSRPRLPVAIRAGDSGEMPRASLSFKVPTAPAFRSTGSSQSRVAAAVIPVFSPADLGAVGVAHRASVIGAEDPFTALGLTEGASVEAARAAFFRLAKLWHPDRVPEDLAPFRGEVEQVFEAMTRAHRTLTDPDERKEFLATGKVASASVAPSAAGRPRADVMREIEQALAKREFEAVETASRALARANPDDSEAHALVAWASTHAGEGAEDALRAALPMLDKAVNNDRDCERASYYRGIVNKRLGHAAAAFRDFARVVQLNPKNVDAQRELRIFEMRARKGGSGEHALDALLSKAKKK